MEAFFEGIRQAIDLILSWNPAVIEIVRLSLKVSGVALLLSTLVGIPLGAFLGLGRFAGKRLIVALMYTGMGFPPVVVGLFVYMMLSRAGPFGQLNSASIP